MLNLTQQEKSVLLVVSFVIFWGTVFQYILKTHPRLDELMNFTDSAKTVARLDINLATQEELVDLPFIGEYTAKNIIEYRQLHGPFQKLEDVLSVKGISEKNFSIFKNYLRISRAR